MVCARVVLVLVVSALCLLPSAVRSEPVGDTVIASPAPHGKHWYYDHKWIAQKYSHFYLTFAATGINDARILLSSEYDKQSCTDCYEVVLGGWNNTVSMIVRGTDEETQQILTSVQTPHLLGQKDDDFWICVADDQLVVGKGDYVWENLLMAVELHKFPVHTVAFSTSSEHRVEFSEIKLADASTLDLFHKHIRTMAMPHCEAAKEDCAKDHILFAASGTHGFYDPLRRIPCPYNHDFAVTFRAMAPYDVLVSFMISDMQRTHEAWEVHLGAWDDQRSFIRLGTQGDEQASYKGEVLDAKTYMPFWISVETPSRTDESTAGRILLRVGAGAKIHRNELMHAVLPDLDRTRLHLAFSGNDIPVAFTAFQFFRKVANSRDPEQEPRWELERQSVTWGEHRKALHAMDAAVEKHQREQLQKRMTTQKEIDAANEAAKLIPTPAAGDLPVELLAVQQQIAEYRHTAEMHLQSTIQQMHDQQQKALENFMHDLAKRHAPESEEFKAAVQRQLRALEKQAMELHERWLTRRQQSQRHFAEASALMLQNWIEHQTTPAPFDPQHDLPPAHNAKELLEREKKIAAQLEERRNLARRISAASKLKNELEEQLQAPSLESSIARLDSVRAKMEAAKAHRERTERRITARPLLSTDDRQVAHQVALIQAQHAKEQAILKLEPTKPKTQAPPAQHRLRKSETPTIDYTLAKKELLEASATVLPVAKGDVPNVPVDADLSSHAFYFIIAFYALLAASAFCLWKRGYLSRGAPEEDEWAVASRRRIAAAAAAAASAEQSAHELNSQKPSDRFQGQHTAELDDDLLQDEGQMQPAPTPLELADILKRKPKK